MTDGERAALPRRIGREVEARLRGAGLVTRAHVGFDLLDEWRARRPDLPRDVGLAWVAFDFPDVPMWDVHVGVLLAPPAAPPAATIGLHVLEGYWADLERLLGGGRRPTPFGRAVEPTRAEAIGEVQLNDPWTTLDGPSIDAAVERLVARAVEVYRAAGPLVAELLAGRRREP